MRGVLRRLFCVGLTLIAGAALHAQVSRAVVVRVNGEPVIHIDVQAEAENLARDYVRSAAGLGDGTAEEAQRIVAVLFPSAAIRLVDQVLIVQHGRASGIRPVESEFGDTLQRMMAAFGSRTREELDGALKRDGASIEDLRRAWERSTVLDLTLQSQMRGRDPRVLEALVQKLRAGARLEWQRDEIRQTFEARGYTAVTGGLLAGNEAVAVSTLRQVISAQVAYASACASGGYAASFESLTRRSAEGNPFLDPQLKPAGTRLTRGGYVITLVAHEPVAQATTCHGHATVASAFTVFAAPAVADVSGVRYFAASGAGMIYQNLGGPIISVRGTVKPSTARPLL